MGGVNGEYNRVFGDGESKENFQRSKLHYLRDTADGWWGGLRSRHQSRVRTYGILDWAGVFLPALVWLRKYNVRECLVRDIVAGVSIGAMVVPQGMSYANLAGLPSVYGLYGAFVPVIIYAALGSSPQLAVGPVAITSQLLSTGIHKIIDGSDAITDPNKPGALADLQEQYNKCAIQVAFLVALMYTAVGVLRLGFLANFLSHSVIGGFTTGAAVIIGTSQLKYFFGVKTKNTNNIIATIRQLKDGIDATGVQWREMVMFIVWLLALLTFKEVGKRVKRLSWMRAIGPITVAVVSILAVEALSLNHKIRIVSHIPSGLPGSTISWWGPLFRGDTQVGKQLSLAVAVMLVDFTESISIAKALARKGKYHIHVTQEIIGLGIANFFGSMFNCYSTTGSFSRSAVSADIGSKTGLFGIFTALVVMLVLLFLTNVFELIPYNAMAAIVVSACFGIFNLSEAIFLWRASFLDFIVWLAACIGVILAGVEIGLAIAVGLALLLVIYQSAFPHTAVLGRLPGTNVYRSIYQYPDATLQRGILAMRVDAPVYFANVQVIHDRVLHYLSDARTDPNVAPIKFVIIDLSPVAFIDATGVHAFLDLVTELRDEGVQLVLANPTNKVKQHMGRVNLVEEIGREWIFVRTSEAVDACREAMLQLSGKLELDVETTGSGSGRDAAELHEGGRGRTDTEHAASAHAITRETDLMPIHWAGNRREE